MGPMGAGTQMFLHNTVNFRQFANHKYINRTIYGPPSPWKNIYGSHDHLLDNYNEPVFRKNTHELQLTEPDSTVNLTLRYGETGKNKMYLPENIKKNLNIHKPQDPNSDKVREIIALDDVRMVFVPLLKVCSKDFFELDITRKNIHEKISVSFSIEDSKVFRDFSLIRQNILHGFEFYYDTHSHRSIVRYEISARVEPRVAYLRPLVGDIIIGTLIPIITTDRIHNKTWEEYEKSGVPTRIILNNLKLKFSVMEDTNVAEVLYKSVTYSTKRSKGINIYCPDHNKCRVKYIISDGKTNKAHKSHLPTLFFGKV